jgi:hypothetical protein
MSNYSQLVLAKGGGPVGYWRKNDAGGVTCADSSGNGHDGTYINTPLLDQAGALISDDDAAVHFRSAQSERVQFGDLSALEIAAPFTFAAWVKPTDFAAHQNILSKWNNDGDQREYLWFILASTGKVRFYKSRDGGSVNVDYDDSDSALTAGVWQHIAFVMETDGDYTFYLNGQPDGSGNWSTAIYTGTGLATMAAHYKDGVSGYINHLNGLLDELAYWDADLSAADILELHLGGVRAFPMPLLCASGEVGGPC